MAGEFNKPAELCLDGDVFENFQTFKEEIDIYFTASETYKKSQNVQVARLLNLMGPEGRKVYNSLKYEGKKSVPDILEAMESSIVPKRNEVMAHFKFFTRSQQSGESFDHWLRELRLLVSRCDFGTVEEKLLRTQIVLGINNTELQEKLLRADADLSKTINLIHAHEAGAQHRRELRDGYKGNLLPTIDEVTSTPRNEKMKFNRQPRTYPQSSFSGNSSQARKMFNCHNCGLTHEIKQCPAFGFTFSFPMVQHGLDVGILTVWTKSFTATSVEGKDVVAMLREALAKRTDCIVDVVAILNDTTGTLVHGAAIDRDTMIGLVLGTGSNAAYMESADRVTHWDTVRHGEKQVIINIEWGALGDNGLLDFIKTDFDRQVDQNSLIVNSFTFEKYISGKYLGEIVRTVLVHLAKKDLIFPNGVSSKMDTPNLFTTNFVSHIEEDTVSGTTLETEKVLNSFDQQYTNQDLEVIKLVCEVVSLRAALLVSACLAVLLKRINRDKVTIAVDGSLYKHHPRFKSWMEKFLFLLAPGYKFKLRLVEDGSSKGGAMTAALGLRIRNQS